MKYARSLMVSAVFILIAIGVAVWLYPRLPIEVPTHWNIHEQVDGYMPRFWGAAMTPLMIAGLAVLMVLLPLISPRKFEIEPFARVYTTLMLAAQGFMLVIGVVVLAAGAGYDVRVPFVVMLAVGALFMVLGNFMGKVRRNFFMGIRTPWTLASDAVWERTHRMGAWAFVLGGAVQVIGTLAGGILWPLIALIVIAVMAPMAYSFVIYRRLEGRHQ